MKSKRTKTATAIRDAQPAPSAPNRVAQSVMSDEGIVSRNLDQELEWFFCFGEAALSREDVGILPSYAAVRILATEPTDQAVRARGLEIARTVRGCLHVLPPRHASVLRAAYTPRRWPRNVVKAFDKLAPIVVRLVFASDPWPERSSRSGLEEAVAMQLSAALVDKSRVPVGRLRVRASRLFGRAVIAYLKVRSLESPSLSLR